MQEKVVTAQINVVNAANRFKSNVALKVNSMKNRVGQFKKQQINKFKKTFMSSDKIRQQKQGQIEARRKKIEQLKIYRNQLISASYQPMSPARSRGVFYIWMFAFIRVLFMTILIIFNIMR